MKNIRVTITAEFSIPNKWEIVDHVPDPEYPEDRVRVLKIGDGYYDFFPECLKKVDDNGRILWSAGEGRTEELMDCLGGFHVQITEN